METTFSFFDLIETMNRPGCPVCNLLLRDARRLMESLLYEYVTDPEIQSDFRQSRGLCNEHGAQLTRIGGALGIAVLYEQVIDELLTLTEQPAAEVNPRNRLFGLLFPQTSPSALADALEPTRSCIVCKLQNTSEANYIDILGRQITDTRLHKAYRDSEGLCLPHFRQVLRRSPDAERVNLFVEIQRVIWSRLRDELLEYMRKSDFQHQAETMGAEGNSWQRAILRAGGEPGVFGMDRAPHLRSR